jgi:hypothetical protein
VLYRANGDTLTRGPHFSTEAEVTQYAKPISGSDTSVVDLTRRETNARKR